MPKRTPLYQAHVDMGAKIIEVNNRDIYGNLAIDFHRAMLGKHLPEKIIFINASGIENSEDIKRVYMLSKSRVDAFLIGTSIMRSSNICKKIQRLLKAGKKVIK